MLQRKQTLMISPTLTDAFKDILQAVAEADTLLLTTHLQPDGDAIGSILALNHLMKRLNKKTHLICHDRVPDQLRFLPDTDLIDQPEAVKDLKFDLGISVDSSDLLRLGSAAQAYLACKKTVCIDHHATNPLFGMINAVDGEAAASGVMVFRLYEAAQVELDPVSALYLYAANSTDTGNFCFGFINEELFMQMAAMMKAGLEISEAARQLHLLKNPFHLKLLGRAMDSLVLHNEGRSSLMKLSHKDFFELGALREHAEGIVNYGLNIQGVKIACLLTENADCTKASLRSLAPYDVSAIAAQFGGGGHVLASGCTLRMPLKEAELLIAKAIAREFE